MTDGDGMAGLIGAGITGMVGLGVIGAMSHMASDMNDDRPRKKKEGHVRNDSQDMFDLLF